MAHAIQPKMIATPIEGHFESLMTLDLTAYDLSLVVAALNEDGTSPRYTRLLLDAALSGQFQQSVMSTIDDIYTAWRRDRLVLQIYDPAEQLSTHEIGYVSLDKAADVAQQIDLIGADLPHYDERDAELNDSLAYFALRFMLPEKPPIFYYRRFARNKILRHGRGLVAFFDGQRFTRLDSPVLQFDEKLDCIAFDEMVYIFGIDGNPGNVGFETIFRDGEHVRREGDAALDIIQTAGLVANFDELKRDCQNDPNKLAKLRNMKLRGMLNNAHLRNFARLRRIIRVYGLHVTIEGSAGKERLRYDPKEKWDLLKLLDDDFMRSPLTGNRYESKNKRRRG